MKTRAILDVIKELIDRAEEARAEWKQDPENNMEYGRVLAFCEALSVIKTDFTGEAEVEKILNFDIDRKYLS